MNRVTTPASRRVMRRMATHMGYATAALALAAVPTVAGITTASAAPSPSAGTARIVSGTLQITSAANQFNGVIVRTGSTGTYLTISDEGYVATASGGVGSTGVRMTAGTGCFPGVKGDTFEVRCSLSGVTKIVINTGDRDDVVINSTAKPATATGGSGNDNMYGGSAVDSFNGGAGDDFFAGGAGNDILNGEAGNDRFVGEAGADQIDGGIGNDVYENQNDGDTVVNCEGTM